LPNIRFIEETHTYLLDDKPLISVTTLMQKHGLAPSYDGVDENVLQAKAKRGTLIHKEIEDYCVSGDIGFTPELSAFIDYVDENKVKVLHNELLVHNDLIAGTIDLVLGGNTIADIKTTAVLHTDAVSWQLSIYAYLYNLTHEDKLVNGKVFHFNNLGELDVKDIPLKPQFMVEKLIMCERNGVMFHYDLDFAEHKLQQIYRVENFIKEVKLSQKKAELEAERLKEELIMAMEKQGIKKFENDNIRITYKAEYEKNTFDSKQFKIERPDLYNEYLKKQTVGATVLITLKD
jgi:hypothetical protein